MASEKTYLEQLRELRDKRQLLPASQESFKYMMNAVIKRGVKINMRAVLRSEKNNQVVVPEIGTIVALKYDAKTKLQLNYWDACPVDIVIDLYPDGWLGLSMHYLPLPARAALLDKMLKARRIKHITEKTRLKLTYKMLKNASKYPEVAFCIKRYLFKQTRSAFVQFPPKDWSIILTLPLAKWQSSTMANPTNRKVWADFRKSI